MANKKKSNPDVAVDAVPDSFDIMGDYKPEDNASDLICRLVLFYNRNPEYKTPLPEITILSNLAAQEIDKFMRRPHKQVTEIYFDNDAPNALTTR